MKILIAAVLVMLSTSAHAQDWTKTDTALQTAYTALHVVDWLQTLDEVHNRTRYTTEYLNGVAYHSSRYEMYDHNVILGKHPSESTVHAYFASTLVAHAVVSYLLPKPWREVWQGVGIGFEGAVVGHNFDIGLRARF